MKFPKKRSNPSDVKKENRTEIILKEVQEGLKQSKEGKILKRGSFAKYANETIP